MSHGTYIYMHICIGLAPLLPLYKREAVVAADIERLPSDLLGTLRVADGFFFRGRDMRYPSVGDVR